MDNLAAAAELGNTVDRKRKALTTVITVPSTPNRPRAIGHIYPAPPPHALTVLTPSREHFKLDVTFLLIQIPEFTDVGNSLW
jgi:hypothetical protein